MKNIKQSNQYEILQGLLKKTRQDMGILQVDLAERLDVPQSFVSKYEIGERRLDILELRLVCKALGISLEEFVHKLEESLDET